MVDLEFILSLRYDPATKSLPKKSLLDYEENKTSISPQTLEDLLLTNIENVLGDYDKVGISLSSGVDSPLVLLLFKKLFPDKKIIAFVNTDNERFQTAELIQKLNLEAYEVDPPSIYEEIPFYVNMCKEPRINAYHHRIWNAAKIQGCEILLTGDGADELFGGYIHRYKSFITGFGNAINRYMNGHINDWVPAQNFMFKNKDVYTKVKDYLDGLFLQPKSHNLRYVLRADYNGKFLCDLLPTVQKISKHYKIQTFSPFLMSNIRDMASHMKLTQLYKNNIGKVILRKILKKYDYFPSNNKIGLTYDLKKDYGMHFEEIRTSLREAHKIYDFVNKDWVERHIITNEYRYINKMYQLLACEEYLNWMKT